MGLLKKIAAIQSMLAQHATRPAVYGVDGGIVHPFCGAVELERTARPYVCYIAIAKLD